MNGTIVRHTGGWRCLMAAAATAVAIMSSLVFVPAAMAQTAPKNGLYLYVCLPGNIGGDLTEGGAGLVVFNVDQGYKFVERISLPQGPSTYGQGTNGAGAGDVPSCKGIDASVQTGSIYPQMTDRLLAVNLATSQLAFQQVYDGGCCDRGVVSPFGDTLWLAGVNDAVWYVASAYNGTLIDPIKEFPIRAHNTQMSPRGDQVLLSPADNLLYLYDTRTHQLIRKIGPFFNRNRPYVVDGEWKRVYANNNGFLGFTAADLTTGQILYRIDYGPIPCKTSSGAHGTCVHGLAMTHDETAMWFPSASENAIIIYDMTGPSPVFKARLQDHGPSGWITCSIDGTRMYPASGTVYDTASGNEVTRLVDENGEFVYSEKLMEVRFVNGKPVQLGDQWCNGQVGVGSFALSAKSPVFGRTAYGYSPPGYQLPACFLDGSCSPGK
jgi:hypothetical protein